MTFHPPSDAPTLENEAGHTSKSSAHQTQRKQSRQKGNFQFNWNKRLNFNNYYLYIQL